MKKLFAALLALASSVAFATTTVPVQLLNPAGSSSGQAIVSTGSSSAPAWGGVGVNGIAAIAANTVLANATGSSASPTAFAMPSCSATGNTLNWTTSTGFTCQTGLATLASPTFTGTPAAPTATAGTNTTQLATTAFVNTAITGGGLAGSFTTLTSSGNDALLYVNTSGQSIPNVTATTVTGWTKSFDRLNANFNASTGTFTAPATGWYMISAGLLYSANTGAANTLVQVSILANGVTVATGANIRQSATSAGQQAVVGPAIVSLTSGQTVLIQANQSTGAAVTLQTAAGGFNYVSIYRLP